MFAPLAAVALVAVMAISLVAQTSTASAVVNSLTGSPTTINTGGVSTLTVDADEAAGNVTMAVTIGTLTMVAPGFATGSGTGAMTVLDGNVINGGFDFDRDGAITATDDCTLCLFITGGPYSVIDGTVDIDASGTITAADDLADFAFPGCGDGIIDIVDGFLDSNEGGAGDAADDCAPQSPNTFFVTYTHPGATTAPGTATVTATQGNSTLTLNITIRGAVDSVELSILTAVSGSTITCTGTVQNVIRSTTGTTGNTTGFLCALVKDSAGTRLPAQTVVLTTTAGTITGTTDVTGATGQRANASTIAAGTSGTSGTTATVTASSGGKTITKTIKFGGDPASCTVTADPATIAGGSSSTVKVDAKDSTGGPVPDAAVINVQQVNAGTGANAAILNAAPTTSNGVASTTVIASTTAGTVAIGAASAVQNPGATCTGTLAVTSTPVTPPTPTPTPGAGFSGGTIAPAGVSIVAYTGTTTQLNTDGAAAKIVSVSATVGGKMITFVIGAPAFVNADFNAAFPNGLNATLVIVKTGA